MDFKPGNFVYPNDILTAKVLERQHGKFGYILHTDSLRIGHNNKMFVIPSGHIGRRPSGHRGIRITTVTGGFALEFLGFTELSVNDLKECLAEAPKQHDIPVTVLRVGKDLYERWDDDLLYVGIQTMPIGQNSTYFIVHDLLQENRNGTLRGHRLHSVKKKGGLNRYPIRRLSNTHYQVQLPQRDWTDLILH